MWLAVEHPPYHRNGTGRLSFPTFAGVTDRRHYLRYPVHRLSLTDERHGNGFGPVWLFPTIRYLRVVCVPVIVRCLTGDMPQWRRTGIFSKGKLRQYPHTPSGITSGGLPDVLRAVSIACRASACTASCSSVLLIPALPKNADRPKPRGCWWYQ
ncbi:hypothetical protein KCP69_13815 [Salmonella enterica subsp. enterica]|nr:hypothetical protein KCP69_13815 [Salmonella enterica subsp. enterica]